MKAHCRVTSPVRRRLKTPDAGYRDGRLLPTPFFTCWRRRREAEIDFTMSDIDKLSRKVPQLCKVAPSTQKYHMEDVHRAGGVIGILGELDRAGY